MLCSKANKICKEWSKDFQKTEDLDSAIDKMEKQVKVGKELEAFNVSEFPDDTMKAFK